MPSHVPVVSQYTKFILRAWCTGGGLPTQVWIQDLESEDKPTQIVTVYPNKNRYFLVEIFPNSNLHLVSVIISDGKEKGTIRYRVPGPD